jgi:hypothetical protein
VRGSEIDTAGASRHRQPPPVTCALRFNIGRTEGLYTSLPGYCISEDPTVWLRLTIAIGRTRNGGVIQRAPHRAPARTGAARSDGRGARAAWPFATQTYAPPVSVPEKVAPN